MTDALTLAQLNLIAARDVYERTRADLSTAYNNWVEAERAFEAALLAATPVGTK